MSFQGRSFAALVITIFWAIWVPMTFSQEEGRMERAPTGRLGTESFYAAIALGTSSGKIGSANKFQSRNRAERVAIQRCGADDCKVEIVIQNGCAALAQSEEQYGVGEGDSEHKAGRDAIRNCDDNCEITEAICADN